MKQTSMIRDLCIEGIRKEFASSGMSVVELNGNHFAGADIALKEMKDVELYRVTVIKHNQERKFE